MSLNEKARPVLFVDMDGVLADFDSHYETAFGFRADKTPDNVDWDRVRAMKDFYLNIPPMADLPKLWSHIEKYSPIVLTGVPKSVEEVPDNKRAWVCKHLGASVEVRCFLSREKCERAAPGDILIDDWEKYKHLWLAKGGRWITHMGADETIVELSALGF